ncbi:ketopantoate reductase family protein [Mesorhizobium sp. M00.F.Ca.ET.186.01.1.1]|nr:ketopantoate reductase family protein [bacterium M00.F.Ca.ET.205.01.1.1]TGU49465.1 ketopantoate reductase family protein [bacterium M00.F.Ca.ET.152.01.1.1]TGV33566.1 ketopantoate reductase family protein [Mesorhizobium sp. M00.F.Ca.ET.186.01.1.1]TGZ40467.1 ketopantoate reductase family protein [bacterium M00.F.Ca.ET.162.01.1.1]TIW63209.1 MAG: ketopantoate reductase family protein [Mesorhizobium sp.]
MSDPRILVLGAGGIGGYFGGRLVEAGADVTFLVREGRRDLLKRRGLRIESQFGNVELDVRTAVASDVGPDYDVVILTCKAYDLEDAVKTIAPALAASGVVLPLLNGVAHIDILNEAFGRNRVMGGSARIQVTLTEDGIVRQLDDWRAITFGEQSGEVTKRVDTLRVLFEAARGVEVHAVSDIMQRMWEKLVHLATAAAMTCLMRANVGEIVRTPDGGAIFLKLLGTVSAIAAARGYRPSSEFLDAYRRTFSQPDSLYTTSMLRDIERRGRTEVDHIIGFMLRMAEGTGVDVLTLLLAYTHIKAYEQRLAAERFA